MSIYKEQRVGVLVDIQNLYYSAKVLHKKKVNFGQILKEAVGDRKLIRAIAYGIKTLEGQEEKFFEARDQWQSVVEVEPRQDNVFNVEDRYAMSVKLLFASIPSFAGLTFIFVNFLIFLITNFRN